jgi:hypothetical protein
MKEASLIRCMVLALCLTGTVSCGARSAAVAPAAPVAAVAHSSRAQPASSSDLARYADREARSAGLEQFEGGGRHVDTTTLIIVLLVVIIVLILV